MIQAKWKYSGEDKWNYKDFKSEGEMMNFLNKDPKEIGDYTFKPLDKDQIIKNNWILKYFRNIKNTKKNWKKVRASPYASLELGLKARKIILAILLPWLAYMGYKLVIGVKTVGFMGTFQKLVSAGIMAYIIWKIYSTIPAMKRQIEYYKKFPDSINYCPTDTKQTVDEILKNIKNNQNKQEDNKNVQKENS
jgi:hypothetical protein